MNRDSWLNAIAEAMPPENADALTVMEFCKAFGVTREVASRQIHRLVQSGAAEVIQKTYTAPDGRRLVGTAYLLKKKEI